MKKLNETRIKKPCIMTTYQDLLKKPNFRKRRKIN